MSRAWKPAGGALERGARPRGAGAPDASARAGVAAPRRGARHVLAPGRIGSSRRWVARRAAGRTPRAAWDGLLTIEFLTPLGWLVAASIVLPAAAAVVRMRRERRVRRILGLLPPALPGRFLALVAAAVALALLAAAAARPAVRTGGTHLVRTDAQAFFVLDVSRSMLAARRPTGATRFERALDTAELIRAKLADVPAGIASLTDRPLPHLFPTTDRAVFSAVLHRVLGIQQPPPEGIAGTTLATSLDPVFQLATAGFFAPWAKQRLVVLLSDGESAPYAPRRSRPSCTPSTSA